MCMYYMCMCMYYMCIGNDRNFFRFGHSAVLHNGTLVIYGGFNGQTKGDIILFHPGHCAHVKEEDECIASYHGLKCVWNRKKDVCEVWGQTGKKNSASLCSPHTRNNTGVCRSVWTFFGIFFRLLLIYTIRNIIHYISML